MGKFSYYCEVHKDRQNIKKGIYFYSADRRNTFDYLRLISVSDKVWRQGPKGGVRITKDRSGPPPIKYITKNEELMKEFVWIKLQAKPYHV